MESEPPSRPRTASLISVFSCILLVSALPAAPPSGADGSVLGGGAWWVLLLLAGVFFALSVVCSAVQTAVGTRYQVEEDAPEDSDPKLLMAELQADLILDRSCWLVGLGTQVLAVVAFLQAMVLVLGGLSVSGVLAATLLFLIASFFLIEVAARGVALSAPGFCMKWLAQPLSVLMWPVRPLVLLVVRVSPARHPEREATGYRVVLDREMRLLPHVTGVDQLVEEEAVEMIDSVREFTERTARDIMTPRTDVEGIAVDLSPEEVMIRLRETTYSRLIVYRSKLDEIEGVLLAKEVLLNQPQNPFSLMRQPLFVDLPTRLPELLRQFRRSQTYLAVVMDEYGGMAGIVTLHDLFEEVIGSHIADEEDEEDLWVDLREDGSALLSGRVELWEINQELDLDLDETVARTIGGYLMHQFGHLPEEQQTWAHSKGIFTVCLIENNRIREIEFSPSNPIAEPAPQEEPVS